MSRRLLPTAIATLADYGVSQAEWLRVYPNCDRCGCPDDRCIGHHHDLDSDCDLVYWLRDDLTSGRVKVRPHLCLHYCKMPANDLRREPWCGNCGAAY